MVYTDLGCYLPSFFLLTIENDIDFARIQCLKDERVLVHELVHFLQDITTTYGLNNIIHTVDVLEVFIKILFKQRNILVPINVRENDPIVMTNIDLFSIYCGDGASKYELFSNFEKIIEIKKEEMVIEMDKRKINVNAITITYGSANFSDKKTFHFGAMAIKESMAILIEDFIYNRGIRKNNFPYDSALMVADYIFPSLSNNKVALAELCEASLMYDNPGEVFIDALNRMKQNNFFHNKNNDTYDFVLSNFILEDMNVQIDAYSNFLNKSDLAQKQLDDLFTVNPFKEERWASSLIKNALKLKNSPKYSIVSEICLKNILDSKKKFFDLINSIGFPILFNSNNDAWSQLGTQGFETPMLFPVIYSIFEILNNKGTECYLINYCNKNNINTDNECKSSPWARLKNIGKCYFFKIWKMWGLIGVTIKSSSQKSVQMGIEKMVRKCC